MTTDDVSWWLAGGAQEIRLGRVRMSATTTQCRRWDRGTACLNVLASDCVPELGEFLSSATASGYRYRHVPVEVLDRIIKALDGYNVESAPEHWPHLLARVLVVPGMTAVLARDYWLVGMREAFGAKRPPPTPTFWGGWALRGEP